MALINEILASRYNQMLAKLLGIKMDRSPAPQLSPEISPGITIESDRAETAFLKQELLWAAQVTIAGVALNHTRASIVNPANSGKLVVITFARVVPLTTTLVLFGTAPAFTAAGVITPIDGRAQAGFVANRLTTTIGGDAVSAGSAISVVFDQDQYTTGATGLIEADFVRGAVAVLPPNTGWGAELVTVNIGASFSFKGYERPFEPGELNA